MKTNIPDKPVSRAWKALLILHIFLFKKNAACLFWSFWAAGFICPQCYLDAENKGSFSSFVEINWVEAKTHWSWLWNLLLGNIKWCFNQLKAPLEFLRAKNGCIWQKHCIIDPRSLGGRDEESHHDAVGERLCSWVLSPACFLVTKGAFKNPSVQVTLQNGARASIFCATEGWKLQPDLLNTDTGPPPTFSCPWSRTLASTFPFLLFPSLPPSLFLFLPSIFTSFPLCLGNAMWYWGFEPAGEFGRGAPRPHTISPDMRLSFQVRLRLLEWKVLHVRKYTYFIFESQQFLGQVFT